MLPQRARKLSQFLDLQIFLSKRHKSPQFTRKEASCWDPSSTFQTLSPLTHSFFPKIRLPVSFCQSSCRISQWLSVVYKAGADDENTTHWNQSSWQSIRFPPRGLRPLEHVDLSTTILGTKFSAPFFICPAGTGKFAHPEGEVLITQAAAEHDVLHPELGFAR